MVTMQQIEEVSSRIAARFQPEKIILFGSYAYGEPTEESDVDLLVIMPFEGHNVRKALEIVTHVDPPFGIDLLVRQSEQIAQRLAWNDWFLHEIMQKGKVLYEPIDL